MILVPSAAAAAAAASRLRQLSSSQLSVTQVATSITNIGAAEKQHNMTPVTTPKRIMFLRHGQAVHNPRAEVARENGCSFDEFLQLMHEDDAYDADLTALGEKQAREAGLSGHVKDALQNVEMIVSSPLSRAIRTADLFHEKCDTNPKRVAIEHFREINGKLLNAKRRPRTTLETMFPNWDFSHLSDVDESWTDSLEPYDECSERGYQGLLWIMQQQEKNLLLVAHGGLLKMMMNDHPRVVLVDRRNKEQRTDAERCVSKRFENCELRSYIISVWKNDSRGQFSDDKEARTCHDYLPVITLEEVYMDNKMK